MFPKTYFLGQNYYDDVSQATDQIMLFTKKYLVIIEELTSYIETQKVENLRTKEEYLIELLMLGTFWKNYSSNASKLTKGKAKFLNQLYLLRKKNQTWKPYIDNLRGKFHTKFLLERDNEMMEGTKENFDSLIEWLKASGEFAEEIHRLNIWQAFIHSTSTYRINMIIFSALEFCEYMEKVSSNFLKGYLGNTASFLIDQQETYKNREDIIFTGRKPNEYYLNMVSSEILNRSYREKFKKTKEKIVLLPTCMSYSKNCEMIKTDNEYMCSECTPRCGINKIVQLGKKHNFKVVLVPHASNFSRWVDKWKNQNHTGIIGVACLLNLLKGGYEMRRLNVPSQCVLLNYSGCFKHWGEEKATELYTFQLLKMINQ